MANLSTLVWTPSPATKLPVQTSLTFSAFPNGSKVQIQYDLQSPELQFQAGAVTSDAAASKPVAAVASAGPNQIVDVLTLSGPMTQITRVLTIEQSGATRPGMARLRVSISDFDHGVPEDTSSLGAMIFFNFPP
jgi:hypothetical protein